ncbi:MAG: helicase-related protein [Bacteroidetes bacterium]|nr:helicase-related protein [Bacteroidota bacterium]
MQIFDNINSKVRDDLSKTIRKDSRVSIASAYFSIYAFEELKKQLQDISELRFIFTSPTFVSEKTSKEKREFYIPRLNRERNLYGSEFEVKLRNELSQKAIAKECTEWIKNKVQFKSNVTNEVMGGFINVETDENLTYLPINGFTTVDLGCEKGNSVYNMVNRFEAPFSSEYIKLFNNLWHDKEKLHDVTEHVIDNISTVYRENSPDFIYFVTLYNIFNEFLEDISEDVLPNDATGFKTSAIWNILYDFQQDAALAIINKLEKYNGCILADSVGLGKTYTALAVVKYYENRNKSVLVLCPKKLNDNWITYRSNLTNNPIAKDRLRYDVLYHTDLSRESGISNGLPLDRINWGNYDLVVIDESHNFRNGGQVYGDEEKRENRYLKLLNKVVREGVKTKVLMLSATPVNNRFNDLRNQLALAYEGNSEQIDSLLNTSKSIDDIFRTAQAAFNKWSKFDSHERSTDKLLNMIDFDFFEVLDSVTIARSRKHIEKYYNTDAIGKFPERLKPISFRPSLTKMANATNYDAIYDLLNMLNLSVYTPSNFIHPSRTALYEKEYGRDMGNTFFRQADREKGIRKLMNINLLKRLESSIHSFRLTVGRIKHLIDSTISTIDNYDGGTTISTEDYTSVNEFDDDDQNTDLFVGRKVKIALSDIDIISWKAELLEDSLCLEGLLNSVREITPEHDNKLQTLFSAIDEKISNPINVGNNKIIVFTAFSDTAEYLYEHVSKYVKKHYNLDTALISGSVDGRTTCPKLRVDMNTVLTCFSPISKQKHLLLKNNDNNIDVLIATDCISEGQNLQDCDYLINYDIHWNPVRIIQRFGRIDRIGSKNKVIQLVNFWADVSLDDYINLKARVETRMKMSVMTSTGDDNPISAEEKGDLEYRKQQLQRLMDEVVDIEEMGNGISIMDMGLNEFRLDLMEYMKSNPDIAHTPNGMHAVVGSSTDEPEGVIYILKNLSNSVNINNQNRLHPFYMVYTSNAGDVICNHLAPKKMLDMIRYLCKGKSEPLTELCRDFNKATKDGRKMEKYSELLGSSIGSIIRVKEESDVDSLFSVGETSALTNKISGLDDFELICFLVVR